jgi:hypothetical protein
MFYQQRWSSLTEPKENHQRNFIFETEKNESDSSFSIIISVAKFYLTIKSGAFSIKIQVIQ